MRWTLLPCDAQARPLLAPPGTPWGRYLALAGTELVGGGGFAGPPQRGTVEIGYFTLPSQQRRGYGRRTAAALLQLALRADPGLTVMAQTRREAAASSGLCVSARILRSLGFAPPQAAQDAELGAVWRWTFAVPGPHRQSKSPDADPQRRTIGHARPPAR